MKKFSNFKEKAHYTKLDSIIFEFPIFERIKTVSTNTNSYSFLFKQHRGRTLELLK